MQGKASAANAWKRLRETKHTHHPVDDARGNAEAVMAMREMASELQL